MRPGWRPRPAGRSRINCGHFVPEWEIFGPRWALVWGLRAAERSFGEAEF